MSRSPRILSGFILVAGLLAIALAASFFRRPPAIPRESGPLGHQIYVWQRAWSDGLVASAKEVAPSFDRFLLLGGEIRWRDGRPSLERANLDLPGVRSIGRPFGIALRIAPYRGAFDATSARSIADIALQLIAPLKEAGIPLAEFQLDFDAAESQLSGFQTWVETVRRSIAPIPLTLTTLASWLKHREFTSLVKHSDGFVLQVHSLERPAGFDSPFTLCDPTRALRDVERAAASGVPFRVALPTYGYTLGFDPKGPFLGLTAEGPDRDWPTGTRLREVRADPEAMSSLVERWRGDRPANLTGVLWYRLPVPGDRLNWRWKTLQAVMTHQPLRPDVSVIKNEIESNLYEIELINQGSASQSERAQITVHWRGGRLVAADGSTGYTVVDGGVGEFQFSPPPKFPPLEPGSRRRIGWFRLSQPAEVSLEWSVASP